MSKDAKNVPALRFKGYSNAWEKRKLLGLTEKIIDFRGRTPRKLNMHWSDSGYLALSALNVKMGYIDQNADAHFGNEILYQKWMGNSELQTGDVILTTEAPLGNVFLVGAETKFILSQRTIALRTNKSQLNPQFLAVLLSSPIMQTNLRKLSTGGTALGISQKNLKFLVINLPTNILEQQAIGSTLMELDSLIAATQDKIDALEQAKKALLQRLFDQSWRFKDYSDPWEKRKLGELAKVRTGKAFKSSSFSPNGKYYVVTNKDIGGPQISTHMDGDRIDITNPVDIAKYSLSGRNLLVTMDGVNIGKTAMYSNEDAVLAQRVGRLTSSSLDFVHQITSQKNFLTRMNELSVGNAIKHISLKQISDYAVNVPQQTSERQLIGQTLSLLDNLIAATQSRLSSLELLKKSLLQDLFI